MKALILSDLCNPEWPSLPIVGYNMARAISAQIDTVVVTQIRNKPNIEKVGLGRAEVVYLDTEKVASPLHKLAVFLRGGNDLGWTLQVAMSYPSYIYFEWMVWQKFGLALRQGKFDVVHRITPMTPTLPSPMASLSPVPFVLGPLNGNLPWPQQFQQEKSREKEWLSNLRNAYKLLPYSRSTYRDASCILGAFDHSIQDLPACAQAKAVNFPEVGIDPTLFNLPERQDKEQLTILYVGRLVPYKLPELVVRAFAGSAILKNHQLIMVGSGPEQSRLEALIRQHQLQDSVTLTGQVTQAQVGDYMRQADIFAFPSIRELGAGVVVEAMACAMACVVVDYGGPGHLIGSDRGVKVPVQKLEALVESFRREMEALVLNPQRVRRLGEAAHRHAIENYAWDAKAKAIANIYQSLTVPQTHPTSQEGVMPVARLPFS